MAAVAVALLGGGYATASAATSSGTGKRTAATRPQIRNATGVAAVVNAANTFLDTLSTDQQAEVLLDFSQANATTWSNLPEGIVTRPGVQFSIGHSIALALSTLGRLDIPAWPVEAFIAASILIGAVHAIRPLFPGREAAVAGLFGIGHGMAFSFVLAELQLSTGRLALSLLGFNLGIELVQVLLVALALPALLVLARLRIGPRLRVGGALITAAAATGWLLDRLGLPNAVARVADSAGTHTTAMVAGLAVSAALAVAWTVANRHQPSRSLTGSRPTVRQAVRAAPE